MAIPTLKLQTLSTFAILFGSMAVLLALAHAVAPADKSFQSENDIENMSPYSVRSEVNICLSHHFR